MQAFTIRAATRTATLIIMVVVKVAIKHVGDSVNSYSGGRGIFVKEASGYGRGRRRMT